MTGKKRFFDILVAGFCLLLLMPVMLVTGMILFLTGMNPLFRHPRMGQNGKIFHCIKFTSMLPMDRVSEGEQVRIRHELQLYSVVKNDPRVTRFGAFIRKTSIDELPQFINVLLGDMSVIGPRPIAAYEKDKYGRSYRHYCSVKPGITGLWQVSGRDDLPYQRRVAIDRYYSRRRQARMDMFIFMKTFGVVAGMKGVN
jgi:lipopolysaccharide/colanic/teichoic acid biosynthesis glycosyltransferase